LPWLYYRYVTLGFLVVAGIVMAVAAGILGSVASSVIILVVYGIIFAISFYFINVVKRYIDDLKEAHGDQAVDGGNVYKAVTVKN
jgi:hypothetical protein